VSRPKSEIKNMIKDGWKVVKEFGGDERQGREPMVLFAKGTFVSQRYNKGAVSLMSLGSRATTVSHFEYLGDAFEQKKSRAKTVKMAEYRRRAIVSKIDKGDWKLDTNKGMDSTAIYTILDENGYPKNIGLSVGKEVKRQYTNKSNDGIDILARMYGNTRAKVESRAQNDRIMREIVAQMKSAEVYDNDLYYGSDNKEYIEISETSPNKKAQEIYKILPKEMKIAMKELPGGSIKVRRDMLHNYFGFRDASLVDGFIDRVTPAQISKIARVGEQIIKDIVKMAKIDIVMRHVSVPLGNFISNTVHLHVTGMTIPQALKFQYDSVRDLREYLKTKRELEGLEFKKRNNTATKQEEARIDRLKYNLKTSPIADLMEFGMYQSIVEGLDIGTEVRLENRTLEWLDKNTQFIPGFIKTGMRWAYLSEGTPIFNGMMTVTQYSDFVARAAKYKAYKMKHPNMTKEEKQNVMYNLLDEFINYDKPSTALEDYLNDMGLFMFTKYYTRIQRTIRTTGLKHPVRMLLILYLQSHFMDGLDYITDSSFIHKSPFDLMPTIPDIVENAFMPTLAELII
jgi:hypothetical protein